MSNIQSNKSSIKHNVKTVIGKNNFPEQKVGEATTTTAAAEKPAEPRFIKLPKVALYFDQGRMNKTWMKHGYTDMPAYLVDETNNKIVANVGQKGLFLHNDFQDLLPSTYTYFPDAEVETIFNKAIVSSDLAKFQLQQIGDPVKSHGGKSTYWKLVTKQEYKVEGDDKVKLGVVIRNSVGGRTALGVDCYTYRLICENGAIKRLRNLHSTAIRHVGQPQKMAQDFETAIYNAFVSAQDLLKIYQGAAKTPVTQDIANQIYKVISVFGEKYLPTEYWEMKPISEIRQLKKAGSFKTATNLVKIKKQATAWNIFNSVTEKQRDAIRDKKIAFSEVAFQQNKLHEAIALVVK